MWDFNTIENIMNFISTQNCGINDDPEFILGAMYNMKMCLIIIKLFVFQNDVIEPSDFTFEKFVTLYHKICPRNDIEELFQQM